MLYCNFKYKTLIFLKKKKLNSLYAAVSNDIPIDIEYSSIC